jgi:hypothetical protein
MEQKEMIDESLTTRSIEEIVNILKGESKIKAEPNNLGESEKKKHEIKQESPIEEVKQELLVKEILTKENKEKITRLLSKGYTEQDILEIFPDNLHHLVLKYIEQNVLSQDNKEKITRLLSKGCTEQDIREMFPENLHHLVIKYIEKSVLSQEKK